MKDKNIYRLETAITRLGLTLQSLDNFPFDSEVVDLFLTLKQIHETLNTIYSDESQKDPIPPQEGL